MRLSAEGMEDTDNVTADDLVQVFEDEAFGGFIILSASDDAFIQAACMWSPSDECAAFLKRTGSDPYRLEYRDGPSGQMYAADDDLTLAQVRDAFVGYLHGRPDWRDPFSWSVLPMTPE